jgi:hypothetical protein
MYLSLGDFPRFRHHSQHPGAIRVLIALDEGLRVLPHNYGGIHYKFDCKTGQVLGRNVARFTIAAAVCGNPVLTPRDRDDGEDERGDGQR